MRIDWNWFRSTIAARPIALFEHAATHLAAQQSRPRPARAASVEFGAALYESRARRASRGERRDEHGVLRLPRLYAGRRRAVRGLEYFRADRAGIFEAVSPRGRAARRAARRCVAVDDVRGKARARAARGGGARRRRLARK